ncbi:hypothetical protein [Tuwongella immobilis]|uniref:Uncharacterized protein n=1 Tax=Tuwongella immobilis TaxID=692036 RepID=A0A6C2YLZ0_9BACT|nr:hypothetical protein [Tuwongella immobilis]VIP02377.1 unnamed protein product [Tuwongella immobilis]VTS01217.1 unnamed protein product [Tuwongella immobilis]
MKSVTQIAVPIALVVGLIFGVTFIANYTTNEAVDPLLDPAANASNSASPAEKSLPLNEVPLRFGLTVAEPKPDYYYLRDYKTHYEVGEKGSFDFWFSNKHPSMVNLTLGGVSCQCTDAAIALVPMTVWNRFQEHSGVSSLLQIGGVHVGAPLAGLSLLSIAHNPNAVQFKTLQMKGVEEIPAADPKSGPQMGIFRLNWEGKSPVGPKRLTATLFAGFPGINSRMFTIEAVETVTPGFRFWPMELSVGDLTAGAVKQRDFYIFSCTREPGQLRIDMTDSNPNPNVVIQPGSELTEPELRELEKTLRGLAKDEPNLVVKSALRFRLDVHETKDGKQMDLGPLNRRLIAKTPKGEELSLPVTGVVRGEVRIAGGDRNNDLIDLGQSFPSNREHVQEVRLVSDNPTLELQLLKEEIRPSYLEITLEPKGVVDGKKTWMLRVIVPAGKLFGQLPSESKVVLKVQGAVERKIRIPIKGQTFDKNPAPF